MNSTERYEHEVGPVPSAMISVVDAETGELHAVSRAEAAAGMVRYGRTLGPGTPACGVWERRALALLAGQEDS